MTGAAMTVADDGSREPWGEERRGPYPIGLGVVLVTVAMLFSAFTAALLVRRTGADWTPLPLPPILWVNTVVLLISSGAVEAARLRQGRAGTDTWLGVALGLGALFLLGQLAAWRSFVQQGVLLRTGPHPAFFYLLSGVHGAHILGGIGVLGWTLHRARRGAYGPTRHTGLTHAAIYWHFMGAVWLWLLAVLAVL